MFILQNQDGYFLSKAGDWIDGQEPRQLFRTPNKDEAVNQLFEINSQDYNLRINLLECEVNSKNLPQIPADKLPEPLTETKEEPLTETLAEASPELLETEINTSINQAEGFATAESHSA